MSDARIAEVLERLERARAALLATGELDTRIGGGRAPLRSEMFRETTAAIHAAEQARNRLLVALAGTADPIPAELIQQFDLTGREAAHIIQTARSGSRRMKAHVLGGLSE